MHVRADLFAFALTTLLVVLMVVACRVYWLRKRSSGQAWETLLGRLAAVDRYKVALIASGMRESHAQVGVLADPESEAELEPEEIWDLIGGMDGLEALGANCEVLIELACSVQETYPEALVVAEQLRLNAREVQWHLARLRDSRGAESLHKAFPHYAQRAVTTYYVMTQSLLALYQMADPPAQAQLHQAL